MPVTPSGTLQGPPNQPLDPFEPLLERPVSRRFLLLKGGVVLTFSALAVRLWQMQIDAGRQYAALAERNRVDVQTIPAPRGVIYDRNGIVLAGNTARWNVTVVPANLPREEAARRVLFAELNRLLRSPWVLAVLPSRLPVGAEADIYGRLAAALGRPADEVAAAVEQAVAEGRTPVLADDLAPATAQGLQRTLAGLPGVMLVSRPEFLVWESSADARLPLVIERNVPRDLALTVESRGLLLQGVSVQPEPGRAYPSGTLAAQVIGYVGRVDPETRERVLTDTGQPVYDLDDTLGQAGMERLLEPLLRGKKGYQLVEVDINRRVMRELNRQAPLPGASVALTLDLGLQKAATEALQEQVTRAGVAAGAVVAIDPLTGEVLALVSLPTFNSQDFSDGLSARAYQALLDDVNRPLINRGLAGLYAPGACIMPFVAVAALSAKVVEPTTLHACRGGIHVPADFNEITRTLFRCWKPEGHGTLALAGALAQSCDVFFFNLAVPAATDGRGRPLRYYEADVGGTPIEFKGLGIERIQAIADAFGFGKVTGIELGGEEAGLLPGPAWKYEQSDRGGWTIGDTMASSIGLGELQVTPLQLAVATAAIANGGTLYRPRLLKSILREGNTIIEEQKPVVAGRIEAQPEHLEVVRQGMRLAVSQGNAAGSLTVPEVVVAGKPGTVPSPLPAAPDRSSPPKPHAWFTAFAPFDVPRIALAVVLEKAGDSVAYAAPVAERMLRAFFRTG
jgi:penicillin-binding protein 2